MSEHSKRQIPFRRILVALITMAYLCAVLSSITDIFSELFKRSTPLFLVTVSVICLWEYRKSWNTAFSIWLLGTFTGLMAIEIAGVWTGFPFGHYRYTSLLGWHILGVPPIIGLNWVIVLLGAIQIVNLPGKKWNKYIKSLLSGVICVIFDIVLEGAVMKLAYWEWRSGNHPDTKLHKLVRPVVSLFPAL